MTERYVMEFHEDLLEISSIIDTVENHELTAEEIVELLNKYDKLKQPNCRNCIHFSCDNADIYCMEKEYDSIPNCSIAKDCDEYEGLYE